ncbi:MAG: outer membrane beta-barrel protein, partial [Bacteroidales bacterium]|nr:outer membrane beta-barrel protein [Bacteroidales bacterium]
FTIPVVNLGIDGALLLSQRGEGDCKQQGLEIPVNLKHTIGLGNLAGLYLAAGPDFYFNFKDVKDSAGLKKKDAQVGLSLGAGLKLLNHLQVGVNYLIPLSNSYDWSDTLYTFAPLGDGDSTGGNIKTKTWQVSAAYIF